MKDVSTGTKAFAEGSRWPSVPLGEVADVLDSKRKPITKRARVAGPYPYYGATGVLDWVGGYLFDEPLVLIGEDGAKWGAGDNSAFAIYGRTWVNNHAHVLRPRRDSILDAWLIYYLNASDLSEFISGMTVPKLNQGRLREIPVPLPPLEEQKRIVAKLDQAFAALDRARAHTEANIADAEELFENHLRLTFAGLLEAWGALPFNEACYTITPTAKIKQKDYLSEGDFPIVAQGAELVSGYWNDYSAVTETDGPVVIFGDHTRHLKHIDFTFVAGADGTKILKPANDYRADYLYFALRSQPIKVTGYARHFKFLKEKEIPELPMLEQQTLSRSLWELEGECQRLREGYEDKLNTIADLRQSLLQEAFAGRLT